MSDAVKTLESYLKTFEGDDGLVIEKATEEAGSKVGDNYTSIMIRTKIDGRYGNGSPYKKSFMTKILPRNRAINQYMRVDNLFFTEKHAYENVLPLVGDFGPRLVHADSEEIIMEDLKEKGYVTCERRDYLDLDHCLSVIKTLAKYHAKSLTIKLKDPVKFENLVKPIREVLFCDNSGPGIGKSINNTVLLGVEHLESIKPRTAELTRALEYLSQYDGKCFDYIKDLVTVPSEKKFVILHGDPWENNILFKHDENGKVLDVKFVDYQIIRHFSPAIDFHYFVYTSARDYVVNDHYDELIETYHRSFDETLKNSGISEKDRKEFDMAWFKSELKRFSAYGLFTGFWLVHAILADEHNVLDMDKATAEDIESMAIWAKEIVPEKAERVKCITLHFMRTYQ